MRKKKTAIYLAWLTLLLGAQIGFSRFYAVDERSLASPSLVTIPEQIGSWRLASDERLDGGVEKYLRPDDYIIRNYETGGSTPINLFVAYFKSLQSSYGPHSPRVCLPGAGWLVQSSVETTLGGLSESKGVPINEYTLEKSGQRIVVLYWYQNEQRSWAAEHYAKLYLLPDLLRYRRSDVALIRIITSAPQENVLEAARQRSREFARALYPYLVQCLAKTAS